jgi:DNA-binding response OmpR family regulator
MTAPLAETEPRAQGAVLCVEDDAVVRIMLREVVGMAGGVFEAAETAREAEALMESRQFDLVLLDRRLPDGDGLLLIGSIRRRESCPIFVLSDMGCERDRHLGIGLGAAEYIAKPFDPLDLSGRIRFVLDSARSRRRSDRAAPITRGDLSFSPTSRRLLIGGAESILPPAEARMLLAMLLREGEAMNRDELTRAACGRDWTPGDRTSDVLIARLRKRLAASALDIVTVHRLGYMLCVRGVA